MGFMRSKGKLGWEFYESIHWSSVRGFHSVGAGGTFFIYWRFFNVLDNDIGLFTYGQSAPGGPFHSEFAEGEEVF
jgi:hypothetical protein